MYNQNTLNPPPLKFMKYKLSIYQRMQQKLALTPQMRQSMQLLGMSAKELIEYIDSLIEKNPLLQKQYDTKRSTSVDYPDKTIASEENPRLSLLSQLRMLNLDNKSMEIAEYLIYEMDDNGYIKIDLEEAAKDLFAGLDEVERVLSVIQNMDPPGIGARDVQECLQLQLKRQDKEDSLEYTIVTEFVKELARNDLKKILETLKIDEGRIQKAFSSIKKLNPKPASTILSKREEPVIPDLIANIKDNDVYLELNREFIPHLRLYNPYENKLEVIKDPQAKEFLKKNMNDAKGLIDSLKRREETMCRVADYILRFQGGSIKKDISQIRSLAIKDVASALKMHPSTISRAVSNKYIQIDDKVMPLKGLLSHGIKKHNGELASKISIKNRIKQLIDGEDRSKPLSDKSIKDMLEKEGVPLKRRTVAKYRGSLRILPTSLRRKR